MRTISFATFLMPILVCTNCTSQTPVESDPIVEQIQQEILPNELADRVEEPEVLEVNVQETKQAGSESATPVVTAPIVTANDGFGPLSPEARAIFWGSTEDPPAEHLDATRSDLEGRHYLTCDELNLHLLYDRVRDLGGGYAGVGTDQAYTFAGWQRPNLVWLTDYDPWVRLTHFAYRAFFLASDDIDTFLSYWRDTEAAEALFRVTYAEHEDLDDIIFVYGEAHRGISRRLRRLRGIQEDADIPSFVSDEEMYTFVRGLVQSDRVRPMIGNLLDDEALLANAEVGRQLDVPIRVYYLSNAEDYWDYPDQFRANMWGSHFDAASLIIRTDAKKRSNGDYAYCMQPALNFQAWLREDYVEEIGDVWHRERVRDETHIPVRFLDEAPFDRE